MFAAQSFSEQHESTALQTLQVPDVGDSDDVRPYLKRDDLSGDISPDHLWWGWHVPAPDLFAHVLGDARSSDLITGNAPETTSPAGRIDSLESIRELQGMLADAQHSLWWKMDAAHDAVLQVEPSSTGHPILRMRIGSEVMGAMIFGTSSFFTPIPDDALSLEVFHQPSTMAEIAEVDRTLESLRSQIPSEPVVRVLSWRLYLGMNTDVIDGTTEEHDGRFLIKLGAAGRAGLLVGRIAFCINRVLGKEAKDPTAKLRRRICERTLEDSPLAAYACPDISEVYGGVEFALVAVHGTMASSVGLAAWLCQMAGPSLPVLRFEHDTWVSIKKNSEDLIAHLSRLGVQRVLLVAHSRGGLVARLAAKHLTEKSMMRAVDVVTLGTPFAGTPIVDGARGALLGTIATLGALRLVGGTTVDAATRLAGFLIRGKLPEGIATMSPSSAYYSWAQYDDLSHTLAFAGTASKANYRNTGVQFIAGLAGVAFQGQSHDLVVSTASAAPPRAAQYEIVNCDHFSYLEDPQVQSRMGLVLDSWRPQPPVPGVE
jgi:pimeloyl-ACP methyl ester carboxylesterase